MLFWPYRTWQRKCVFERRFQPLQWRMWSPKAHIVSCSNCIHINIKAPALSLIFKLHLMTIRHNHPFHVLEYHPIILTTWCNAAMALQRDIAHHQLRDVAGEERRDALTKCEFFFVVLSLKLLKVLCLTYFMVKSDKGLFTTKKNFKSKGCQYILLLLI